MATSFEINLDPEAINKMVSDTILQSALGQKVKDVVDESVKNLGGWNSPVNKAIEKLVYDEIQKVVTQQHAEKIEAAVKTYITDSVLEKIIKAAWDAMYEKVLANR